MIFFDIDTVKTVCKGDFIKNISTGVLWGHDKVFCNNPHFYLINTITNMKNKRIKYAKTVVKLLIAGVILFIIRGDDGCGNNNPVGPSNPYPDCLHATDTPSSRTYFVEYDYMSSYDCLISFTNMNSQYERCKITIDKSYGEVNPYLELDCEGRRTKRDSLLIQYTQQNMGHGFNVYGYLCGIDRVLNDPNIDIGGVCLREGSGINPAFVYTGRIHEVEPNWGYIMAEGVAIHELGHQIAVIGDHGGHGGSNESCCIMNGSYPNGYCQVTNIVFCDNHICWIHNQHFPR